MNDRIEIIIFDTEYTAWEGSWERGWSKDGEHREIIQIAAAHVIIDKEVSILSEFDIFAKPKINSILSEYIKKLTGITQDNINKEGISLIEALKKFSQFCGDIKNIYCWGNDEEVLRENCSINDISLEDCFNGYNFFDIRHVFKKAGINTDEYQSGSVYKSVNLPLKTTQHYALHDVYSMSETLNYLAKKKRLSISEFSHCPRSLAKLSIDVMTTKDGTISK